MELHTAQREKKLTQPRPTKLSKKEKKKQKESKKLAKLKKIDADKVSRCPVEFRCLCTFIRSQILFFEFRMPTRVKWNFSKAKKRKRRRRNSYFKKTINHKILLKGRPSFEQLCSFVWVSKWVTCITATRNTIHFIWAHEWNYFNLIRTLPVYVWLKFIFWLFFFIFFFKFVNSHIFYDTLCYSTLELLFDYYYYFYVLL